MQRNITREEVERVARMYKSCKDAGAALGIAMGSFSRLCRKYGIETPHARKQRRRRELARQARPTKTGSTHR